MHIYIYVSACMHACISRLELEISRVELSRTLCLLLFMQAGKTLSVKKWQAAFSPEGYLDIGKTLSRIHRGVIVFSIIKPCFNMFQDRLA